MTSSPGVVRQGRLGYPITILEPRVERVGAELTCPLLDLLVGVVPVDDGDLIRKHINATPKEAPPCELATVHFRLPLLQGQPPSPRADTDYLSDLAAS